jgi:predicted molibdopterin-dependent oxidoreductase YjgC
MARAIVHPALANVKGLVDGSKLLIRSGVGELVAEVRSSDDVREDTVMLPHGTWIKRGGAANQLTEDLVSTSGDMAAYYSTMVTIEPKAD